MGRDGRLFKAECGCSRQTVVRWFRSTPFSSRSWPTASCPLLPLNMNTYETALGQKLTLANDWFVEVEITLKIYKLIR